MNILSVRASRLIYHPSPLNLQMRIIVREHPDVKYKRDYFGVYAQDFNDTKDNGTITVNITHTPAGQNQIYNITHTPEDEHQIWLLLPSESYNRL